MLVLTRRPGERVHIGGDITFVVLEVKGNRVRIGIDAPRSVSVMRAELDGKTTTAGDRKNEGMLHAVGNP